jgi:large conductance mechanosensitive channel
VEEFRKFIARGNVIDLAVGLVIGAAFATVVGSFVEDILMPPVGLALGGVDFSNLFVTLSGGPYATLAEAREAGAATINYGLFVNNVITFAIVAFAVFLVVRAYNRMRMPEAVAPTDAACPFCQIPIPLAATRCGHCTSELPVRV